MGVYCIHMPPEPQPALPVTSAETVSQTSLRSPGGLLRETWRVYTTQFATLVGISAVPVVTFSIFAFFAVLSFGAAGLLVSGGGMRGLGPALLASFVVIVLVVAVLSASAGGALVIALSQKVGFVSAYRQSARLIGPYIWIGILSGLAIMVGFILLVIPGVILLVWFCLSVYILVVEGARGTDALKRSKAYVEGHWWAVFGRLCLLWLLLSIVSGVSGIVSEISPWVENTVGLFVNVLVAPFVVTYLYVLYQDLRGLKEAARA